MTVLVLLSFIVSTLVEYSAAYSSGAPVAACSTLQPNHDTLTQPSHTNPYQLDIEQLLAPNGVYQYIPGVTYTGIYCMYTIILNCLLILNLHVII